jgi:hypothetical protein
MVLTYKTSHVKGWQEEGSDLLVQGFFRLTYIFLNSLREYAFLHKVGQLFHLFSFDKKLKRSKNINVSDDVNMNMFALSCLRVFFCFSFFLWGGSLSNTCHKNDSNY